MILLYLVFFLLAITLPLRYRIKVKGLDKVAEKGMKGILFLPNHPALIDPVIMNRILFRRFRPRALVDIKQIRQTILKYLQEPMRILPLPDMKISGMASMDEVKKQIHSCAEALKAGDNLLLYPAGRLYRGRYEKLRGNGGVAHIINEHPDVRIVLVRTKGLWGSSFSRAKGYQEPFMTILSSHVKHVLLNLIFFLPKREVEIEFCDLPEDCPKYADKDQLNRYLENFYNQDAPPNTYSPYYFWEWGGSRTVPEPDTVYSSIDTKDVPDDVRATVYKKLHEMTPKKILEETNTLGTDLGLDSLNVADLQAWLQTTFGHEVNNIESLRTVGSVLMAAIGQSASAEPLLPIPPAWFVKADPSLLKVPEKAATVTDAFLINAKAQPKFVLLADQATGVITNSKAVLAIMVLKSAFEKLPGEKIGIMMPACAPAFIIYMATLFAGKIPVMINWTVGSRNMDYCIKSAGINSILTSSTLVERLEGRGTDFSAVKDIFIYLEELKKKISLFTKLRCLAASRLCWRSLRKARVPETAAILFTSGSESRPKTVPLTHENVLNDIISSMDAMGLRRDDCVVGMLPPFHSFGLLLNFLMPACANLRVVYHANPTEGDMLARIIAAYHATMIVGTPTFASCILRNATQAQMQSVRMLITGAEKCPEATYKVFREKCPNACFLEGYGITECSPVVALNRPEKSKPGTIGYIISCLEWRVLDKDGNKLGINQTGMLHLHGKSVFNGYLNYDGPSPFIEMDGKSWYKTGDLVQVDEEGFITFMGRLKRFIKVGGEMVSLPAIEEVLLNIYRTQDEPIPLAVEAKGTDAQPIIILFTVLDLDKDTVNQQLREAGMSPIHSIRSIVKLPEIPLLGSGKTDYQALKALP